MPGQPPHSWAPPLHPPGEHGHSLAAQTAAAYETHSPRKLSPSTTNSPIFLPPIARVTSSPFELQSREDDTRAADEQGLRPQYQLQDVESPKLSNADTYQQPDPTTTIQPRASGNLSPALGTGAQGFRSDAGQFGQARHKNSPNTQGTADGSATNAQTTARKPNGVRMPTPPPQQPTKSTLTSEPSQQRSGKARLNLLNPMSLLARRRTSQVVPQLASVPVLRAPAVKSQEFFDPRIRGTRVHDFNAPRPRRNLSHGDVRYGPGDNYGGNTHYKSSNAGAESTNVGEKEPSPRSGVNHTPVFTEDFEEEQYPAAGPHVRKASDISDLTVPRPAFAKGSRPLSLPPGSKSPEHANVKEDCRLASAKEDVDHGPPVPPKNDSEVPSNSPLNTKKRIAIDVPTSPSKSTGISKSRSRSISQVSGKDVSLHGFLSHTKSTSSRFSFDMIGAAEQERILEDRHRQKALDMSSTSPVLKDDRGYDLDDGIDDDFDYDGMDDDDGFEERIPGINADATEESEEGEAVYPGSSVSQGLKGFTFHPIGVLLENSPMSPVSTNMILTPRDENGDVIGFAKGSPGILAHSDIQTPASADLPIRASEVAKPNTGLPEESGLGLQGVSLSRAEEKATDKVAQPEPYETSVKFDDDDDLYFDDGIIDDIDQADSGGKFDESIFDMDDTDQYGRPKKPLSILPTLYSPPDLHDDLAACEHPNETESSNRNSQAQQSQQTVDSSLTSVTDDASPDEVKPSVEYGQLQPQPSVSLTHDTLLAYQHALAAAAHQAAANGRFRRDSSSLSACDERDEDHHSHKEADSLDISPELPYTFDDDGTDDFDYDDALADDAIIAEANAEALANDADGFYGQEFGFYSAPAANEAFYANGGYFGPHGIDGLVRSKSGRIGGREPNLTPITERSEYSNRNSIQLGGAGYASSVAGSSVPNPGLAQLADLMSEQDDENMSLSALMKLRRGAWGGSQASSIGNGSPVSGTMEEFSPNTAQSIWSPGSAVSQARRYSTFSISETSSAPASPTLPVVATAKAQDTSMPPPAPPAALLQSLSHRPLSPTMKNNMGMVDASETDTAFSKQGRSHRHTGSADSISYMLEGDAGGGERWVLERRRTAESGEVEILGREVVSGGRI